VSACRNGPTPADRREQASAAGAGSFAGRAITGLDRVLGVVMVFSAGAAFAAKTYGDWTYFLKREAIYSGAGLLAFLVGIRLDYSFLPSRPIPCCSCPWPCWPRS